MFEAETRLDILERLKTYYADVNDGKASADEGTFSFDELSANAKEFEKAYAEMSLIIEAAFPQTSWGQYLDYLADALAGISRRAATAAVVELTVAGKAGARIPKGYQFTTEEGTAFSTDASATIGDDGTVIVKATATTTGAGGNVKQGTITQVPVTLYGVESVTNVAAAHDGYEEENDDSLRERLLFVVRRPVTSGNANHYWTWATSVSGVGQCKVLPLWNGPGTVKVLIVDANNKIASAKLIKEVADYIEEVRPIGATVTVVSPQPVAVNIDVSVEGTLNVDTFKATMTKWLKAKTLTLTKISPAQVGKLILESGASDYDMESLTLNGSTSALKLTDEQIATVGEVTTHAMAS